MRLSYLIFMPLFFAQVQVQAMDTELIFYKPFESTNIQGRIAQHYQGECQQLSQRVQREDAWRCSYQLKQGQGHEQKQNQKQKQQEQVQEQEQARKVVIADPCFIKQYGNHKEALCPKAPWGNQNLMIDLKNPVGSPMSPEPLDFSRSFPWALELENGDTCLAVDEGKMFDHMPVHYDCEQGGQLFGSLQRCKSPWTVLRERDGAASTVVIKKAWF